MDTYVLPAYKGLNIKRLNIQKMFDGTYILIVYIVRLFNVGLFTLFLNKYKAYFMRLQCYYLWLELVEQFTMLNYRFISWIKHSEPLCIKGLFIFLNWTQSRFKGLILKRKEKMIHMSFSASSSDKQPQSTGRLSCHIYGVCAFK